VFGVPSLPIPLRPRALKNTNEKAVKAKAKKKTDKAKKKIAAETRRKNEAAIKEFVGTPSEPRFAWHRAASSSLMGAAPKVCSVFKVRGFT
jgi:menaquinone-dependent protoporphyrinogen IX oxidase